MAAAPKDSDAEAAVRRYLLYLEDPAKLRDEAEIQDKTRAVLEATDPIDKLKALAELERTANIDEQPLRMAFMEHAKAWATEQDVPVSAFRELKIPDDVLRDAGFDVPTRRRRGRPAAESRQQAKAVSVEELKAHILTRKDPFILADIISRVGGSQATVRKAVDEVLQTGQIKKLGPIPDHRGRGRAPIQYTRS